MNSSTETLQAALDYRFRDERWLQRALTHRSAAHDNNERLEFLGDALLNLVVADVVFHDYPKLPEGDLSRLRAALVRESSLAEIARTLTLGEHVQLGAGELRSGGFRRDSILADTLEALIGAVFLDGGFDAARSLCLHLLKGPLAELPDPAQLKDAKTRLQEFLQARSRPLPDYQVVTEEGPAHRRHFAVNCTLGDDVLTTVGEGASRKVAEQRAAQQMLDLLERAPRPATDQGRLDHA
ncbi:MAG: ribonuclease [Nevskia sp.]|nr:ribonuclease [Nevskia sp.]